MSLGGVSFTNDSGEQEYTHVVATVTAAGSTVIFAPPVGQALRVRWISAITDPSAASQPLIRVFLGTQEKYRAYALVKRQRMTGPVDGALSISLDKPGAVAVTVLLEIAQP